MRPAQHSRACRTRCRLLPGGAADPCSGAQTDGAWWVAWQLVGAVQHLQIGVPTARPVGSGKRVARRQQLCRGTAIGHSCDMFPRAGVAVGIVAAAERVSRADLWLRTARC